MADAARLQSLLQLGNSKLRAGDTAAAIAAYDQVLSVMPGHTDALESKAAALVTTGNFEAALQCHNELVNTEPRVADRYVARARVYVNLSRYSDAIPDYEIAVTLGSPDASLLKELGLCLRRAGHFGEAIATYTRAAELNSQDADLQIALGDALLDAGRMDEAMEAFSSSYDGESARFTDVDWTTRGDRLSAVGRYADAITMYRAALNVRPNPETWVGLAQAYLAAKQLDDAIAAAEAGLKLAPEHAVLLNTRGCGLFESRRIAEAAECFAAVTRLAPDESLGWSNAAVALHLQEQNSAAVDAIRRAIELSPADAELWGSLARYQMELGANEAALESSTRSLELASAIPGLITHSMALRALHRLEEAQKSCERALEIDSSDLASWELKAAILLDMGQPGEALATLDDALTVVDEPHDVLRLKSFMLSDRMGRHNEALEALRSARELSPDDNDIACSYAEMLIKTGHYEEGRVLAEEQAAKQTRPSRISAMRFMVFVSYALCDDASHWDDALESFIDYYVDNFVLVERPPSPWEYGGLLSAIRDGSFSATDVFMIETLVDLQAGRIAANDVSYVKRRLDARGQRGLGRESRVVAGGGNEAGEQA